jgi:hypothetical protein
VRWKVVRKKVVSQLHLGIGLVLWADGACLSWDWGLGRRQEHKVEMGAVWERTDRPRAMSFWDGRDGKCQPEAVSAVIALARRKYKGGRSWEQRTPKSQCARQTAASTMDG